MILHLCDDYSTSTLAHQQLKPSTLTSVSEIVGFPLDHSLWLQQMKQAERKSDALEFVQPQAIPCEGAFRSAHVILRFMHHQNCWMYSVTAIDESDNSEDTFRMNKETPLTGCAFSLT
jgi:hypothetical protein